MAFNTNESAAALTKGGAKSMVNNQTNSKSELL